MGKVLKARNIILLMVLFVSPVTGYANFDFNANCLKAYKNIFELKLNNARSLLAVEKKTHPQNAIVPLLENYIDFFYLITTENQQDFNRMKESRAVRLEKIEDDDEDSPYYLYAQAEINLQMALLRSRFGEYFNAAIDIRKANAQLNENHKKFPSFHLNLKGIGLINAVLGNLPEGLLKRTLSTFGIKGDLNKGLDQMEGLLINLPKSTFEPFYEETVFYYSFVLTDIARKPEAYAKTIKYTARISDGSLLKAYLKAYVSIKSGKNQEAIEILEDRPSGNVYQAFPYLDYLTGIARLNKLDYSGGGYFNKFLQSYNGINYIKDSYLHLGWIALLKGEGSAYTAYMNKVKGKGSAFNERDKQAVKEASAAAPMPQLLKGRLLFDGGYFTKSMEVLSGIKPEALNSNRDKSEYYYRYAKNNDELGRDDTALAYYSKAIAYGKNLTAYFAANSALQMGRIYQNQGQKEKAKQYYTTAINMKNHDYETSIEQEAKNALNGL